MTMADGSPQQYWATLTGEQLITELNTKQNAYLSFAQERGYFDMWMVMIREYFGTSGVYGFDAQGVSAWGQEAELIRFRVAELRSHLKQVIAMSVKDRPAFKAVPTNNDYGSRAEIDIAETGIEYVYKRTYGEAKEREAEELCELFAAIYTWVKWDANAGDDVIVPVWQETPDGARVQTGTQQVKSGMIATDVMLPWEQFCDPTQRDQTKHLWRGLQERRSKWEVAASFPDQAQNILGCTMRDDVSANMLMGPDASVTTSDDIFVKHFYHARSVAMPKGRHVIYVGNYVLYDTLEAGGELPTELIPVVPLLGSQMLGSALGYSDAWDLVVLQQVLTQITSDQATSISTSGKPAMFMDKGTEIDHDALANGNFVLVKPMGADKPEWVQPPSIGEASFRMADLMLKFMGQLSGLNAVVRGDTTSEIKSGQHAALYHAVAQEFMSDKNARINMHREGVANLILDILRRYSQHPFMAELAGADELHHLEAFSREKFSQIRRVTLETTKPRNLPMQMETATFLQGIGTGFETPQQAVEFIHTGRIKPLLKSPHSKLLRIQGENDSLARGEVTVQMQPGPVDPTTGMPGEPVEITPEIPVYITDDPFLHVPEHLTLIDGPDASRDQNMVAAVQAHIAWHMREWRNLPPDLAMALGIQPHPIWAQQAAMEAAAQEQEASGGKSSGGRQLTPPKQQEDEVANQEFPLPNPAKPPQGANINA